MHFGTTHGIEFFDAKWALIVFQPVTLPTKMDFSSRICIPCDFFFQIFTVQMFMTYVMNIKITRFSHVVGEQFSVTCFTISFVVIIIFVTKIIYSTVILRKIELNIVHQPPGMTSTMKFAYVIFSTMKTKGPPLFLFFGTFGTPTFQTNFHFWRFSKRSDPMLLKIFRKTLTSRGPLRPKC